MKKISSNKTITAILYNIAVLPTPLWFLYIAYIRAEWSKIYEVTYQPMIVFWPYTLIGLFFLYHFSRKFLKKPSMLSYIHVFFIANFVLGIPGMIVLSALKGMEFAR